VGIFAVNAFVGSDGLAIAGIAKQLHNSTNLVTNLVTNPVIPAKQVVDLRELESRA